GGRGLLWVPADRACELTGGAGAAGVPVPRLAPAAGDRLSVKDLLDVSLADATTAWRDRLPTAFGAAVTHD
ncbi:MAG TPA: hypothetical protein PKA98_05545, partial [Acidimicrobiales bacterium]|nr:hypothetical protein [Acidimicrobiales bacterium]